MLNVQVRQVSVETIEPSTPTPDDRKTHKLCFLDQFMPALYTTIILFYNTSNAHDKVLQLKESLSQTLTKFYPLAGKIYKDNIVIDCNDEGIPFSVAHADFSLLEFLEEPNVQLMQHFLPCKRVPTKPITELPLLTIQVTVFTTCGGLAIGGCFNHKILDGASIGCFLKNWASTLRGCDVGVVCPDFVAVSKDFPPKENIPSPGKKQLISPITYDSCKLRRYVFDQSAIQALKTEARSEKVPNPTRVEVVSAFMWKHLMAKSILFYDTSDDGKRLPRLKESLSETLTSFYPLAGRIKDDTSIDCNDEGILYVEARADCSMHDFLKEPDIQLLNKLLPCKKHPMEPMTELPQVALQVTVFTCGGLSIAGCYNHKIMDGASIGCFLKKWAANLSGCHNGVVHPDLATASRTFPPGENIAPFTPEFLPSPTTNMCILRRFVFDATALQVLLEKTRSEQVPNPTRTEVVSAFIWKHAMTKTIKSNHGSGYPIGKLSFLTHFVNVSKHASLPKGSIGCLILTASAMVGLSSARDQELDRMVSRVHDAISSMDEEYVKTFQGEGALEAMWKNIEITLFDKEAQFICSSWCKLGLDEVDFGWGKPIWVSPFGEPPSLMEKNSLILMDANGGKDIEALLVMQEKQMVALEHDEEFLAFATPAVGVPISTSC